MTVSIDGRLPKTVNKVLLKDCEAVRDELVCVLETLRQGSPSTGRSLTAVQETAKRIRILSNFPHAAPLLYELIESVVCSDIRKHFDEGLRIPMNAKQRVYFLERFYRANLTIANVVRFCAQSLEGYGSRCRSVPLHRLQVTAMLPVFDAYKDRLAKAIEICIVMVLKGGEDVLFASVGWAVRFFKDMSVEMGTNGALVGRAVNSRAVVSGDTVVADEWTEFVKRIATRNEIFCKDAVSLVLQRGNVRLSEYVKWVSQYMANSAKMYDAMGMGSAWPMLLNRIRNILLRGNFKALLEDAEYGLRAELNAGNSTFEVFSLLTLVVGSKNSPDGVNMAARTYRSYLKHSFKEHIANICTPPEDNVSRSADVQRLAFSEFITFAYHQQNVVISRDFRNHPILLTTWVGVLSETLRAIKDSSRLLSNYIDVYLASTQVDDAEEGGKLDLFKSLFSCLVQKDAFFEHYRVALARRLLRGQYRRTSESQMLTRLKMVAGNTEVHQLAMMISDMDTSDKLSSDMAGGASMEAFLSSERLKARAVLVASQYWPGLAHVAMVPAPIISKFITLFESFYQARFSNRKIRWLFQSSTGVVSVRFAQGPKDITGSLPQVTIMLLVDGTAGMRIPALVEATGLPKETVADAIASMYMNKKCNVIECFDPRSGTAIDVKRLSDGFLYRLNAGFRAPVRKIDLPKPAPAKPVDTANIEVKRKELANIAIVRYMKSRGVSQYSEMLDGCLRDLRQKFDAQPPLVKAQLDFLIEKEYVRRDEADSAKLIYIA